MRRQRRMVLRRLLTHLVIPALGFSGACVWSSGNPELPPPRGVDGVGSVPPNPASRIAWASEVSPTEDDGAQLERLRESARAHRAASADLRSAERTACAGLSEDDRDVSPFFHARDILYVLPLRAVGGPSPGRIEGAVVTFARVEGLTPARLQRLLDCQTARDAALGDLAPETRWCPLAVSGAFGRAAPSERGIEVRLAAGGREEAAEVYTRAVGLLERGSNGPSHGAKPE